VPIGDFAETRGSSFAWENDCAEEIRKGGEGGTAPTMKEYSPARLAERVGLRQELLDLPRPTEDASVTRRFLSAGGGWPAVRAMCARKRDAGRGGGALIAIREKSEWVFRSDLGCVWVY
jgi:hypothetical protein